ncbi:Cellulose binding elicitor lectin [Phytophthora cinnamomi]|uniref:Cellulose binding elicitor lectin n=1 Tax=Phytophthora cinnamomi TaxID=4785 RepID=UPI00355A012B|nr:Cellulose binding elicitor lectin [Phytophthora cinnamomi]
MRTLTVAATAIAVFAVLSDAGCPNTSFGKCGDVNSPECCTDGNYCMPWTSSYYQCLPLPSQCARQFTGYDFYGGDIKTVYGLQPGDCCATCLSTSGCLAYTFFNEYQGSTACFLKAGMGQPRKVAGAISAVVDGYTSDQDHTPKRRLQGNEPRFEIPELS